VIITEILYDVTGRRNPIWRFQDRNLNFNMFISAFRQYKNEIEKSMLMFSGSTYSIELLTMFLVLTGMKSKKAASKAGYTYISACKQDRN